MIEKAERLIEMLHDVTGSVKSVISNEELESLSSAIELVCDIRDRLQQKEPIPIPKEVKTILEKEAERLYFSEGLSRISGAWYNYEIIEEYDNGWGILFSAGIIEDEHSREDETKMYLRKDTLKFTENEEEVEFVPED